MSLEIVNVQNSMVLQMGELSPHAHKILFALLAQVPNPVTGVLQVKIPALHRTMYPERSRVNRHFKTVLDQALIELETYHLQIIVGKSWKGFKKLSSRNLIKIRAQDLIEADDPDTIISALDEEFMIEGTILKISRIDGNQVTARFNPILLELFTTSEQSYVKIPVKAIASLKKQLSPRLLELLPLFRAIANLNGHSSCFEWSWRGESQKIPSVLKAFPPVSSDELRRMFPDRLEPALKEMIELGILRGYAKTQKSPKRIHSILLEFPLQVEQEEPEMKQVEEQTIIQSDELPF